MSDSSQALENLLKEERLFPPSPEFVAQANATADIYEKADADWLGFWQEQALNRVTWFKEPTEVLDDSNPPFFKWFKDGELNLAYNCLDRHLDTIGDKVAYHWVGEPGDTRDITYRELYEEVGKFANALKSLGVEKGDRVAVYLGMVPELPVTMLACARIGAIHSVVFGGFSSDSLSDRIQDAEAKVLVTSDGSWRKGKVFSLKENADIAVSRCPSIRGHRCRQADQQRHRVERQGPLVPRPHGRPTGRVPRRADERRGHAVHPVHLGNHRKAEGHRAHPGRLLTSVMTTHNYVFDIKDDDIYWCGADIGWVTGHSYIVYGPLANGVTGVMYEGAPNFPDNDRLWKIIEDYKVTIFYTAPTAIRAFMKWGDQYPAMHDLSSLRLLGTVGEPINPEAWMWYNEHIGARTARSSTPGGRPKPAPS